MTEQPSTPAEGQAPAWEQTQPVTPDTGKLQEQINNLNKALSEERKQLKEYKDKEAEAQRQEAIKKGDFEKVTSELNAELDRYKAQTADLSEKNKSYEAFFQSGITSSLDELWKKDPTKKTLIEWLVAGKSTFEQFNLIPQLISQLSPNPVGQNPRGINPTNAPDKQAAIDSAVQSWSFSDAYRAIMQE